VPPGREAAAAVVDETFHRRGNLAADARPAHFSP
jgi:hypothetical protein